MPAYYVRFWKRGFDLGMVTVARGVNVYKYKGLMSINIGDWEVIELLKIKFHLE